jgi:hypothetical protein
MWPLIFFSIVPLAALLGSVFYTPAIVERIVRRHEGRVWAEGEPGTGAAMYVALPRSISTDNDE